MKKPPLKWRVVTGRESYRSLFFQKFVFTCKIGVGVPALIMHHNITLCGIMYSPGQHLPDHACILSHCRSAPYVTMYGIEYWQQLCILYSKLLSTNQPYVTLYRTYIYYTDVLIYKLYSLQYHVILYRCYKL
jgi:hypothetical protein